MILNFEYNYSTKRYCHTKPHISSYKKLFTLFCLLQLPIAVEVLPSIPLVPRLQTLLLKDQFQLVVHIVLAELLLT
jgi:hypothetical protein